jgi:hypothetical protein
MRAKQILLWVLIFSAVGLAVAGQPVRLISASSAVAALPLPQASQFRSGVFLVASISPTCAGATWYSAACTQPYAGEFVVTALNGEEVTRVSTNQLGQAMVTLPPGQYIVGVRTENIYPWAAPVVVTIVADRYTSVSFNLDSGLRWLAQSR